MSSATPKKKEARLMVFIRRKKQTHKFWVHLKGKGGRKSYYWAPGDVVPHPPELRHDNPSFDQKKRGGGDL